jgi:hypothetical protein
MNLFRSNTNYIVEGSDAESDSEYMFTKVLREFNRQKGQTRQTWPELDQTPERCSYGQVE